MNSSPFQQWLDENFKGIIASPEIMMHLAKAFEGGRLYEQEDCAKVCESEKVNDDRDLFKALNVGITRCATAIRARKF